MIKDDLRLQSANALGLTLSLPCGVSLPNRIGKSAMTEGLADAQDNPTPELMQLYKTWSEEVPVIE